jgi:hypothetical protein
MVIVASLVDRSNDGFVGSFTISWSKNHSGMSDEDERYQFISRQVCRQITNTLTIVIIIAGDSGISKYSNR